MRNISYKEDDESTGNDEENQNGGAYYSSTRQFQSQIQNASHSSNESKLSFYTTVELELYPGKKVDLSEKELSKLKCSYKWNDIKRSYSQFLGKPYVIKPNFTKKKQGGGTRKKKKRTKKSRTLKKKRTKIRRTLKKNKTKKSRK